MFSLKRLKKFLTPSLIVPRDPHHRPISSKSRLPYCWYRRLKSLIQLRYVFSFSFCTSVLRSSLVSYRTVGSIRYALSELGSKEIGRASCRDEACASREETEKAI